MMHTVINGVNPCGGSSQGRSQFPVELAQSRRIEMSFSNSGLVGNNDDDESEVVHQANGLRHSGKDPKLRWGEWRIHHADVLVINEFINHAVAVKEYGTSPR